MSRAIGAIVAIAFSIAGVSAAKAQSGDYFPPKLVKQGASSTPIAGPGTVVVKVLVKPDGSFTVSGVIRSTNHANDAAALEIAKTSRYKAATRAGKPVLAFYDFSLKFTGSGVSSGDGTEVGRYEAMLRAGNFSGAKTGLTAYVQAHPGDARGEAALGVANVFLGQYADAAAAFDRAGTVPANDRVAAGKAYIENAVALVKSKQYDDAIASAKKATLYEPNDATYNTLGFAELEGGKASDAVADFEKALSLSQASPPSRRAPIEGNLAVAYARTGDLDKAKAMSAKAIADDPKATAGSAAIADAYASQAQAKASAGDFPAAAALFETGATAAPANAVSLYTSAAFAYLSVKSGASAETDAAAAKAEADARKALAVAPQDARANYALGVALADQKKYDDALAALATAKANAGSDTALAQQIDKATTQISAIKARAK